MTIAQSHSASARATRRPVGKEPPVTMATVSLRNYVSSQHVGLRRRKRYARLPPGSPLAGIDRRSGPNRGTDPGLTTAELR